MNFASYAEKNANLNKMIEGEKNTKKTLYDIDIL